MCRAFVRKAKKLQILRFRNDLPTLLDYIRKATAISLLPRQFFLPALEVLRAAALQEDRLLAYVLRPFFEYVQTRWINNPYRNNWMSLFNADFRTNNACETTNRMLRRKTGAFRPNVFLFIQAWATIENNASLDSELLGEGGDSRRTRRWQSVFADRQLKALSRDLLMDIFHDRDETLNGFLSRASHLFHGAFNEHVLDAVGRGVRNANAVL